MLAVTMMASCKQNPETTAPEAIVNDSQATVTEAEAPEAVEVQTSEPVKAQQTNYFDSKASKPAAKQGAITKAADRGKVETIYVEADDSHGRVWGHVTMRGDRGSGTIHDEGENTWAVTVTRHGNELYAVDQNSRQYVFKLKQNKTQE